MKPLEPFPIVHDRTGRRYYLDAETAHPESTADLYIAHKRFKTGELAAEYWSAAEEATSLHFRAAGERSIESQRIEGVLYRFAQHDNAERTGYL